jgi:hypothetical protein
MSNPRAIAATHILLEIVVPLADHASQRTQGNLEHHGRPEPETFGMFYQTTAGDYT